LEALLPAMIERRGGRVAIVASVAGYRGLPTSAAYGMTKAGLINMAEALKPELDGYDVRLQLVNPGFVRTPLTDKNPFPMPFLMEVEDAAEAFYRGLRSDRFEIVFPRRFAYLLKVLRCLPAPLAFAVTRRLVPEP
jgi:short-subunit dehydrogenase